MDSGDRSWHCFGWYVCTRWFHVSGLAEYECGREDEMSNLANTDILPVSLLWGEGMSPVQRYGRVKYSTGLLLDSFSSEE